MPIGSKQGGRELGVNVWISLHRRPIHHLNKTWNSIAIDDAWRRVTPLSVEALGQTLRLQCNACGRLRCERCGERMAHCRPEPYDSLQARR